MFYYSLMTIVILQLNQSLRLVSGAAAILLAISNSNFNEFFFFLIRFAYAANANAIFDLLDSIPYMCA